jgi:DNA-binding response OmpR family regulator
MKAATKLIAEQPGGHSDKAGKTETHRTQLLIISDCAERESKLRAALDASEIEITTLKAPDRLSRVARRGYDLAIVDVGLERIAGILQVLRSKAEFAGIPVLVECSRISNEPGFAGLLPQYRAMPCRQPEIIALVNNRITPAAGSRRERGIL